MLLLPSLGRQGQSVPCNIFARPCVCVCVSVRSINAWVSNSSLNGGSTWRPVQSFSSGPVRSWSPTPCRCQLVSIQSVRESIYSIVYALALRSAGLWSPTLYRVVWIFSIVRSSWRVRCRVLRFSQAWSFTLVTSCTCTSWCMQLCTLPAAVQFLILFCFVSMLVRADWSCDSISSNSVRQIKSNHSAWSPVRHPGESPLFCHAWIC